MLVMLIGYARTSTVEQKAGLEAQVRELANCDKVFQGQVSSIAKRQQLDTALDFIREGDTLVVTKLDRLARSTRHLMEIVDVLKAKGILQFPNISTLIFCPKLTKIWPNIT